MPVDVEQKMLEMTEAKKTFKKKYQRAQQLFKTWLKAKKRLFNRDAQKEKDEDASDKNRF